MNNFRVLVANELRYYREVIANAVLMFRPEVEVKIVEPSDLDSSILQLAPDLVVCSRITLTIRTRCFAWVELYPNEEPLAIVCINGQCSTMNDIELDGLLSIIDQAKNVLYASAT